MVRDRKARSLKFGNRLSGGILRLSLRHLKQGHSNERQRAVKKARILKARATAGLKAGLGGSPRSSVWAAAQGLGVKKASLGCSPRSSVWAAAQTIEFEGRCGPAATVLTLNLNSRQPHADMRYPILIINIRISHKP